MSYIPYMASVLRHFRGNSPANVTVGATSTSVIAANQDRTYLILTNDSNEVIYLGLDNAAESNKGIRLAASGGSVTFAGETLFKGAVNAICASGSKVLSIQEGE